MKLPVVAAAAALALTACASPAENAAPAEIVTVTVTEPANVTDVTALDEREASLDEWQQELKEREVELDEREAEAEPAPATYVPRKRDFELSLTTLEKECFGSSGCLIDVRVDLAYGGRDLDPSETYEVTYEVTSGDDTIIDTLDFIGDEYEVSEHSVDTESKNDELSVQVTSVRNRGF